MTSTILVVGATGNTGRNVVNTLPSLLANSKAQSSYRILALTRSKSSAVAQKFAKIPGVEVEEQTWTEITEEWLRERNVTRVFIASHNEPSHFADEGQFLTNALRAGVKYVVRISTTAANVTADCPAYYPRSHWAIEEMLSAPEFKKMHWTSLQPNVFQSMVIGPAVALVKHFKGTGKQDTLRLMLNDTTPTGVVDADDVGTLAAHLLAEEDTAAYNQKKLVINGPDITGEYVTQLVGKKIGEKVRDVRYQNLDFLDDMAAQSNSPNLVRSIKHAPVTSWEGKAKSETTSKEVLELAAPRGTIEAMFEKMLADA
ncbi:putative NmrA-like domain, NAD(P)-binding domain superfamily [Septoria linicola]|nr:putative NmrA-like domain, NAD(P)-binding domain superfamily [Septoria linicola]